MRVHGAGLQGLLLEETQGQLHLLALQSVSEGFKMEDGRGISQLKWGRGHQAAADRLRNQRKTVSVSDFSTNISINPTGDPALGANFQSHK